MSCFPTTTDLALTAANAPADKSAGNRWTP